MPIMFPPMQARKKERMEKEMKELRASLEARQAEIKAKQQQVSRRHCWHNGQTAISDQNVVRLPGIEVCLARGCSSLGLIVMSGRLAQEQVPLRVGTIVFKDNPCSI